MVAQSRHRHPLHHHFQTNCIYNNFWNSDQYQDVLPNTNCSGCHFACTDNHHHNHHVYNSNSSQASHIHHLGDTSILLLPPLYQTCLSGGCKIYLGRF